MTEIATARNLKADAKLGQAELIVSGVLRYGVLISMILTILGVALLVIEGSTGYGQTFDVSVILSHPEGQASLWPHTLTGIMSGALAGRPYAVILLGLGLLIATPLLRVAISVFIFLIERDHTYVAITLFVLGVLIISILLGVTEGHG